MVLMWFVDSNARQTVCVSPLKQVKYCPNIDRNHMTILLCMPFYFQCKQHEYGDGDMSACSDILHLRSHPFNPSAQLARNSKES